MFAVASSSKAVLAADIHRPIVAVAVAAWVVAEWDTPRVPAAVQRLPMMCSLEEEGLIQTTKWKHMETGN
jgi:hypothetical protein